MQLAIAQNASLFAELFKSLGLMADNHDRRATQPFAQNAACLSVEFHIRCRWHAFVNQIDVEFKRKHQRERKPRAHALAVGAHGHVEIFVNAAQPTAKAFHIVWVQPIKPRDIAGVFRASVFGDNAPHEPKRKGNATGPQDAAFIGLFQTGHHVDQCGLAGAIWRQNPNRCSQGDAERCAIKDHLALCSGPEGFRDRLEFDHLSPLLRPAAGQPPWSRRARSSVRRLNEPSLPVCKDRSCFVEYTCFWAALCRKTQVFDNAA